jgi:signal transduction histidine kinase
MSVSKQDQEYLKKLTVLYVEDEKDSREQLTEFLSRPVGTLITANNGIEGLDAFSKHKPDIVLTDILMPGMDGLTMANKILEINPMVPIIAITAFEQTDYLMRAINIGIFRYVSKPVNSYMLFESLLECAHRLRAEEQLELQRHHEIQLMQMKHNKTLAILSNGIANDFNNLLQAILESIPLIRLSADDMGRHYIDMIEKYTDEANVLAERLSILGNETVTRMKSGQLMPLIKRVIEKAVKDTAVTCSFDCPEKTPNIRFADYMIQEVFECLVENALENMPSGGALHLSARLAAVTEHDALLLKPGNYLHISLADTGTGISPVDLPKIFDPYFTTKEKDNLKGKGLSLAICHTIIIKHGGIITAESVVGKGATFHIWLPLPK